MRTETSLAETVKPDSVHHERESLDNGQDRDKDKKARASKALTKKNAAKKAKNNRIIGDHAVTETRRRWVGASITISAHVLGINHSVQSDNCGHLSDCIVV